MPTISTFSGVAVLMYYLDDRQHSVPHMHAEYADSQAVFDIANGEVLAGSLQPRQTRLAKAWIEIHRDELLANWQLAVAGEEVFRIEADA